MSALVRVAAALLFDAAGRVLLAQRPQGKSMAGLWEFPGGKLDGAETPEQALRRELREELGIDLRRCHLLRQLRHDYGQYVVELEAFAHWIAGDFTGAVAAAQEAVDPEDIRFLFAILLNKFQHRTIGRDARYG